MEFEVIQAPAMECEETQFLHTYRLTSSRERNTLQA
jgi:hypothetical protein